MLTKRKREVQDWKIPRVWRAAIYLREPEKDKANKLGDNLSVKSQRLACRCAATVLHAEVVGEFVDLASTPPSHSGLRRMLELASQDRRLDYLIVYSLDQLAADRDEAFEVAWTLGFAGTVIVPADAEAEFPWTTEHSPS